MEHPIHRANEYDLYEVKLGLEEMLDYLQSSRARCLLGNLNDIDDKTEDILDMVKKFQRDLHELMVGMEDVWELLHAHDEYDMGTDEVKKALYMWREGIDG